MKHLFYLVIILFLFSCGQNKFQVDVSDIKTDLVIMRTEKDLLTLKPDSIAGKLPELRKKYGTFFEIYTRQLLQLNGSPDSVLAKQLEDFLFYCISNGIGKKTNDEFTDFQPISDELNEAFKHYKYYFPNQYLPVIYTCLSGFNVSVFTSDSLIGISLDKFLGENCAYYTKLAYEKYLRRKMDKAYITAECMRAWAMNKFPANENTNNLMDAMIYEGKIQYFLDAMLPEMADTIKWGYTTRQLKWMQEYEKNVWDYMVEQKILFSTNVMDARTFTGEAGFTAPFRNVSAPRAGTWIGYKIICAYMANNPTITLEKLMTDNNLQNIYNLSNYKP